MEVAEASIIPWGRPYLLADKPFTNLHSFFLVKRPANTAQAIAHCLRFPLHKTYNSWLTSWIMNLKLFTQSSSALLHMLVLSEVRPANHTVSFLQGELAEVKEDADG